MIEINIYTVYKIIFFAFSLSGLVTLIIKIIPLIKYTKYLKYSKFIPNFLTKKLTNTGENIIKKQINQTKNDLLINFVLLIILLILNIFLWLL